jgi:hypothetical protein
VELLQRSDGGKGEDIAFACGVLAPVPSEVEDVDVSVVIARVSGGPVATEAAAFALAQSWVVNEYHNATITTQQHHVVEVALARALDSAVVPPAVRESARRVVEAWITARCDDSAIKWVAAVASLLSSRLESGPRAEEPGVVAALTLCKMGVRAAPVISTITTPVDASPINNNKNSINNNSINNNNSNNNTNNNDVMEASPTVAAVAALGPMLSRILEGVARVRGGGVCVCVCLSVCLFTSIQVVGVLVLVRLYWV